MSRNSSRKGLTDGPGQRNRQRLDLRHINAAKWREGEDMELNFNVVAPRYFETMRIPLVRGRDFTPQD